MANSRRQRRAANASARTTNAPRPVTPERTTPPARTTPTRTTTRPSRRAAAADTSARGTETTMSWAEEYAYIYSDLRHLVVVSIIIFILLFVVGYFI